MLHQWTIVIFIVYSYDISNMVFHRKQPNRSHRLDRSTERTLCRVSRRNRRTGHVPSSRFVVSKSYNDLPVTNRLRRIYRTRQARSLQDNTPWRTLGKAEGNTGRGPSVLYERGQSRRTLRIWTVDRWWTRHPDGHFSLEETYRLWWQSKRSLGRRTFDVPQVLTFNPTGPAPQVTSTYVEANSPRVSRTNERRQDTLRCPERISDLADGHLLETSGGMVGWLHQPGVSNLGRFLWLGSLRRIAASSGSLPPPSAFQGRLCELCGKTYLYHLELGCDEMVQEREDPWFD